MITLYTGMEAVGVMRNIKYLVGAAFALSLLATGAARADVQNSAHDLSGGTEEICVYCHTPHNGDTASAAPLWNRTITSTTFTMYASPTLNMNIAGDPQASSLACLSCHDGVTGYNSIIRGTATDGTIMAGLRAIGEGASADLSNDHPISITYDISADTAFNAATGLGSPGANVSGLPLYDRTAGSNDQVECGTCHDPHDPTDGTIPSFLRSTNVNSALCTTCHIK
jgi:predicted CXXCH cytochrome family protein